MTTTPLQVLPTPEAIGEALATRVLDAIARARAEGRHFLLGCPTGRTPRPIYEAMGRRLATTKRDLSHLVLVMMDEYLVGEEGALAYAPDDAPWSCHDFTRTKIVGQLDGALPPEKRLRAESVWFPDPRDPAAYDGRIADAGGLDFFLLASGASDGHVGFNPPGSARDSRTRIVALSAETRRDNLQTFPSFGTLDAVPRYGITVGIATIAAARQAAMVVWGAGKRVTLARMLRARAYEPAWPATVIHECAGRAIVSDAEAAKGRVAR